MAQYVLVYELEGYREDGAGTYSEQFGMDKSKMHNFVQDLVTKYKERFKLVFAGLCLISVPAIFESPVRYSL
jgi:hypothetical protein